jgi:cytidylate kinase
MSGVRKVLVLAQREVGREHPRLVTEGRDQGSVVFPNADVKFYLDAKPQVRAKRRTLEMAEKGEQVKEDDVLAAIIRRDERDMARDDGPLTCPADAIRVDTSDLTREEVVTKLESLVREKTGSR